ncbi:hypothetical protein XAP6164_810013 [Xanthomonas phaseoli pv. phaseoli]|nr:hypothetical protein XAP6164_810013 [Xanthomonas phaseoli pv. phaseoli]
MVERALDAEMTEHLGHDKHEPVANAAGNTRNGRSRKTLKGEFGELPIEIPRDRHGSFAPQLIPKHQTRWAGCDDKILSLYARGMTVRKIQSHLEEMYGTEVSPESDFLSHRCGRRGGQGVAGAATGSGLSDRLSGLHPRQSARGRGAGQGGVPGHRHHHGRREGSAGPMAGAGRGCQVLAASRDGATQPRGAGHLHCLRRWPEGVSRGDRGGVPADHRAAVHRAHGAAQPELRLVETPRRGCRRSQAHLRLRHRRGGRAGTDRVRGQVGRPVPAHQPVMAAQLVTTDPVLRLPTGDPQGDLYDQRHRVGQHEPAQADQEPRRVPQRRSLDETVLPGSAQHHQKMDAADPRLEGCAEPLYDPVRGATSSAVTQTTVTQNSAHAPFPPDRERTLPHVSPLRPGYRLDSEEQPLDLRGHTPCAAGSPPRPPYPLPHGYSLKCPH